MLTFGITVDLSLRSEQSGVALPAVKAVIGDWARQKMASPRAVSRRFSPSEVTFADGNSEVWRHEFAQVADFGGTWITEVQALQLRPDSRDATATIAMRLEFEDAAVAPARFYVEPPVFLKSLSTAFHVFVGSTAVPVGPKHLDSDHDVEAFLGELESSHRALPIVLVTESVRREDPIPDLAELLASALFGMAIVTRATRDATFALTREVGRPMSCFDGAVRIYWPGWRASQPPFAHPLFLGERVAASARNDPTRPDSLIRTALLAPLVRAATSRFSYPMRMRSVVEAHERDALEREFRGRSEAEVLAKIADLSQQLNEQRQFSELAVADNADLRSKLDGLRAQLDQVTYELDLARKAPAPAVASSAPEITHEPTPHDDSPWAIESADDAIARARSEFSSTLVIPNNVHVETSMGGGYWYHVLLSLHSLCELERQGKATNKRAQLRQLLVENVGVSKDTYKTADTGIFALLPGTDQRVQLRERVHLQEGKPADTESVYWQTIGEPQSKYQYLIGRIGRHA
jgi:hypothetical protein